MRNIIRKNEGFTLAEVLITLAVIGVIAAILFPSILANYTERTLKTKRQAFVARMSQAMGELSSQFGNYEDATCDANGNNCTDKGSALKFINEGLAGVYKIAASCDETSFSACDIPKEIIRLDGEKYSVYDAISISDYNPAIGIKETNIKFNTKAAAFMTKNGESVLLMYNPRCGGSKPVAPFIAEERLCINMIYDLNGGKNKPNRVNDDIGVLSVFYNDMPYVISPKPYDLNAVPDYTSTENTSGESTILPSYHAYEPAKTACTSLGEDVGLASLEELMSIIINSPLLKTPAEYEAVNWVWSGTMATANWPWIVLNVPPTNTNHGISVSWESYNRNYFVRCAYKD